jgi:hypothetical protein
VEQVAGVNRGPGRINADRVQQLIVPNPGDRVLRQDGFWNAGGDERKTNKANTS